MRRVAFLLVLLAWPPAAVADDDVAAARAVAEGEELARQGRFRESVDKFKQAEAAAPRAAHDCYVALAYRRLERWGQARLFADRCRARATAGDGEPAWMARTRADIDAGIARARLARVEVVVEPAEAAPAARMTASELAADEAFPPGVLWLPAGRHVLSARADGFEEASAVLSVTAGEQRTVLLVLTRPAPPPDAGPASVEEARRDALPPLLPAPVVAPPVEAPPVDTLPVNAPAASGRGPWPYVVLGVAGATLVTGAVFHAKALGTRADAEESAAAYDRLIGDFESQRRLAIGGYAVAAAAGAVGVWLWTRTPAREPALLVGGGATGSAAVVWLEWRR